MFTSIHSLDEVQHFIQKEEFPFIYVSKKDCSVCHGLLPQVEKVLAKYPRMKGALIDTDEIPEFSGQYTVFTVSALVLFYDGKEQFRDVRFVPMQAFEEKVKRIYTQLVELS